MIKIGLCMLDDRVVLFVGLNEEDIVRLRSGMTTRTVIPPGMPPGTELMLSYGKTNADLEEEIKAMIGDAPELTAWPGEGKDS